MERYMKFTLLIVLGIILLLVIDFVFIFTINKLLFAIKQDNGDSVNLVYKGLLYDTYVCYEYSVSQIKGKGTKFVCSHINIT